MSEKGAKCQTVKYEPNNNDVLSNKSDKKIDKISMKDCSLPEGMIKKFQAKHQNPKKERWAIEFNYGEKDPPQFVAYFTEQAAKNFVEEVNRSFTESKCKPAGFRPTADSVLCNLSDNEIGYISMSDRHMPGDEHLGEKNRWAIEFEYGGSQFVAYFTEEAAKIFKEKVNESFNKST